MKKLYWLLISVMLLDAGETVAQTPKDTYVFPVIPGTEQWKQFKTGEEMVKASQIPTEVLTHISTPGLVATCLSYPILPRIMAYNDLQTGFVAVAGNFNGLQELLKRPDAGQELLRVYRGMDPNDVKGKEASKKGDFTFEFTYIEILISQPEIIAALSPSERKALARESLSKFKAKDNQLDTFSGFGEITSALVLGRVLEKEEFSSAYQAGKRSSAMQAFLAAGRVTDTQVINQIVIDAQSFLK